MTDPERTLRLLLRLVGSVSLLAIVFVMVPYSWMDAIHTWLGLGSLPAEPIVGYLARSTSAFYALLGGLLWVLSFDLRGCRATLYYLSGAIIVFGVILAFVDSIEGLPLYWKLVEGPFVIVWGVVMLTLTRRLGNSRP